MDRNELGSHANKDIFVRGCSFPDYGEIEIWPQDTTDGASVRYGKFVLQIVHKKKTTTTTTTKSETDQKDYWIL